MESNRNWTRTPTLSLLALAQMSSTALNLSSSRLRTSTPTRAIHSTLTARASPSIPPATQTYEPLVKAVLLHRLIYSIFSYSAGLSWALTVIWTTWDQGGLSNIGLVGILYNMISPSVWVLAAFNWAIGPLPVVILRKTYLTSESNRSSQILRILIINTKF